MYQRCNVLMFRVQVRRPLAHSLHEVAVIIGGETAVADLLPIFETFLKDLDEVLPLLLAPFCFLFGLNRDITRFCRLKLGWFDIWQRSCTSFLPTLESSTFLWSLMSPTRHPIGAFVNSWRGTFWCAHTFAYAQCCRQLGALSMLYGPEVVADRLVPISVQLCQDSVAGVRRVANREASDVLNSKTANENI